MSCVSRPEFLVSYISCDYHVLTACLCPCRRACNILPYKYFGVVGQHRKLPVEALTLSRDGRLLASCSHDHLLRFWDVGYLYERRFETKGMEWQERAKKGDAKKLLPSSKVKPAADFFSDLPKDDQGGTFFWD